MRRHHYLSRGNMELAGPLKPGVRGEEALYGCWTFRSAALRCDGQQATLQPPPLPSSLHPHLTHHQAQSCGRARAYPHARTRTGAHAHFARLNASAHRSVPDHCMGRMPETYSAQERPDRIPRLSSIQHKWPAVTQHQSSSVQPHTHPRTYQLGKDLQTHSNE